MPGLSDFQHCMQIASRPAIYRPSFTEKTPENTKIVENSNNFQQFGMVP
jgi:hypothetical protein